MPCCSRASAVAMCSLASVVTSWSSVLSSEEESFSVMAIPEPLIDFGRPAQLHEACN